VLQATTTALHRTDAALLLEVEDHMGEDVLAPGAGAVDLVPNAQWKVLSRDENLRVSLCADGWGLASLVQFGRRFVRILNWQIERPQALMA
jgi:hypothetical protein